MIIFLFRAVSTQATCLMNSPTVQPYDIYKYPGQSWIPDDQCKQIYGTGASFCKVSKLLIAYNSLQSKF